MGLFLQLIVGLVLMVISYLIMPKPKPDDSAITEADNPTADAGRPIPVLFGTKTIKSPNCLWFGDKQYVKRKVKA